MNKSGTHGYFNPNKIVISDVEPPNPSDWLFWYNPERCTTTTTTACELPDNTFEEARITGISLSNPSETFYCDLTLESCCNILGLYSQYEGTERNPLFITEYVYVHIDDGDIYVYNHETKCCVEDGYYIIGEAVFQVIGCIAVHVDCPTTTTKIFKSA